MISVLFKWDISQYWGQLLGFQVVKNLLLAVDSLDYNPVIDYFLAKTWIIVNIFNCRLHTYFWLNFDLL